ncbi:MAG: NAD(+) synthase, partial [Selenomonadaceae bacterium]|nr:NAD(+) synthase [Selenomonadaceae bacterium]
MYEARKQKADLVIFPEMAVSGRLLGATWIEESFMNDCWECSDEIINASKRTLGVVFGGIERDDQGTYGAIFAAKDKRLLAEPIDKNFPDDGKNRYAYIWLRKKMYRFACIFDGEYFSGDADFCIRFTSDQFSIEKNFFDDISAKCPMIRIGPVGIENTGKTVYTFDGNSAVFNSRGELVQRAEPFTECLNFVELDEIDKMPAIDFHDEEEPAKIYRALHYGVTNFLEQIGLSKVVIGVSGGIDSAVASALYTKVLGPENVLLVNMPSVFNSATTKNLSEQLAKNLGCKYCVVPIQESVDRTVEQLESTPITFLSDGSKENLKLSSFVRENIQARDRSARILAALAATIGGGFT